MNKMIEIEVDCNSDVVTVFDDGKEIYYVKVEHPHKFINLFSEILNRLHKEDGTINHIAIVKVDEDYRTTLEEW